MMASSPRSESLMEESSGARIRGGTAKLPPEASPPFVMKSAGVSGAYSEVADALQSPSSPWPGAVTDSAVAASYPKKFHPGCQVEVIGMKGRPELNGMQGVLAEYADDEERWIVCLRDGGMRTFRAINLQSMQPQGDVSQLGVARADGSQQEAEFLSWNPEEKEVWPWRHGEEEYLEWET